MEEIVAFMRTKYPEMFPKEIVVSKSLKKFEDLFIEETQEKIM